MKKHTTIKKFMIDEFAKIGLSVVNDVSLWCVKNTVLKEKFIKYYHKDPNIAYKQFINSTITESDRRDRKIKFEKKRVNNSKASVYSKKLKKKITKAESLFKNILDNDGYDYKFQKYFYDDKHCYIVDFYAETPNGKRYVFEIDGSSHDSERAKKYDNKRTKFLKDKRQCKVIRFRNEDVYNDPESVRIKVAKIGISKV